MRPEVYNTFNDLFASPTPLDVGITIATNDFGRLIKCR
jgi:hypothetical protein